MTEREILYESYDLKTHVESPGTISLRNVGISGLQLDKNFHS